MTSLEWSLNTSYTVYIFTNNKGTKNCKGFHVKRDHSTDNKLLGCTEFLTPL